MATKQTILPWKWKNHPVVGSPARQLDRWLLQSSYRIRDRFVDNPRSAARFAAQKPPLTTAQQRVVEALRQDGIAVVPFRELVPDAALWERLSGEIKDFVQDMEDRMTNDPAAFAKMKKNYLLRRFRLNSRTFTLEDPWLRLGFFFAEIVNEYLGLWTKLAEIDHWYTRVGGGDQERIASQRWHRDPEDKKLIKIFMYFSDVDEGSGPFEYIPGTGPGGAHEKLWPWTPSVSVYPPLREIEAAIPQSQWKSCTGPAGTIVFCNTSGLHRGGFCQSKPRILATWKFLSPAAVASYENRLLQVVKPTDDDVLSEAARFAIT
jgi:hypothetical protein